MTVVLLAIRPPMADAILDGIKPFEFRRVAPSLETPYPMVLYASGGVGSLVGTVTVDHVVRGSAESIVERVDTTPSSPERIVKYLRGGNSPGALRLQSPRWIDPVPWDLITDNDPPQNFIYVSDRGQIARFAGYPAQTASESV